MAIISDMTISSRNGFFTNFREKHPKVTKAVVTTGKVMAVVVCTATLVAATYVGFNKPDQGKDSPRAHVNKYGNPKVGYNTPQRANFQVIKDVILHRTIMHPYKCQTCKKYHVGHKY